MSIRNSRKNKVNISIEEVIHAYKNKDFSKISPSTVRKRLIKEFGENYLEILNPPKQPEEDCKQIQKLYEHGLKNNEISKLYGMKTDKTNRIIIDEYKKRKLKKPRIINQKAFKELANTGIPIEEIKKQAESQNSIIPEEYIEEYIDPNNFVDTNSIRRRVIEILETRKQNGQATNFADSFKFAELIKEKGYTTKYQATALIYKLIKDNIGINTEDFEIKNHDVKEAIEVLLNTKENTENELANIILQETEFINQKNGQER